MIIKALFSYTTDLEQDAIDKIGTSLKKEGLDYTAIDVIEANRACRNAYGKEMDPEEFDSLDPNSDEAWFNDYDFILQATIESDESLDKIEELLQNIDEYTEIVR